VYNHADTGEKTRNNRIGIAGQKRVLTPKKWENARLFSMFSHGKGSDFTREVGDSPKKRPQGGNWSMTLMKCPRCDLNYITPDQKYCKVCLREMKGEGNPEEVELCSICNEAPALPGKDVCLFCLKEMNKSNSEETEVETQESVDANSIGDMDSVSGMDEIIPEEEDDIPGQEYGEMEHELSLEEVREDEERDAGDDEDEDDM